MTKTTLQLNNRGRLGIINPAYGGRFLSGFKDAPENENHVAYYFAEIQAQPLARPPAARRAADLLGLCANDQICIAAAVFDLACQAKEATGRAVVSFDVVDDLFRIACTPAPAGIRSGTVPQCGQDAQRCSSASNFPRHWPKRPQTWPGRCSSSRRSRRLDLFEEMQKINQDLLGALLELKRFRETAEKPKGESNAA